MLLDWIRGAFRPPPVSAAFFPLMEGALALTLVGCRWGFYRLAAAGSLLPIPNG